MTNLCRPLPSLIGFTFLLLLFRPFDANALQLPNPPIAPENNSECQAFSQKWRELFSAVADQHTQCLAENKNSDCAIGQGGGPGGNCYCHRCQHLHALKWRIMLGDLNDQKNQQVSQCYHQVREHKRLLRAENRKTKANRKDLIPINDPPSDTAQINQYFEERAKKVLVNQVTSNSKKIAIEHAKGKVTEFRLAVEIQKRIAKAERRTRIAADFLKLFNEGGTTEQKLSAVTRSAVELKYASSGNPISNLIFAQSLGAISSILGDSLSTMEREFSRFPSGSEAGASALINARLAGIDRLNFLRIPQRLSDRRKLIAARENSEAFESAVFEIIDKIAAEKLAEHRRVEAERQKQAARTAPSPQNSSPSQSVNQLAPKRNECFEEHSRLAREAERLERRIQIASVGSSEWNRLYEEKRSTVQRMLSLDCS